MNRQELFNLHEEITKKAFEILKAKNNDYANEDSDPFANFKGSETFGIHPIIGILLRTQDKMKRIETFTKTGSLKVKSESVEDAVLDSINYMVLILGMIREEASKAAETKINSKDITQWITINPPIDPYEMPPTIYKDRADENSPRPHFYGEKFEIDPTVKITTTMPSPEDHRKLDGKRI